MEQLDFQDFWKLYLCELKKFRMHLFQVRTNCKKFIINVRASAVKSCSVALQHDFAEALTIKHQKEIQSMHFGDNVSASIEGHTVHYPDPTDDSNILFDFHSFLSDDKQQDSATVDNHMDKLIVHLKDNNFLHEGGRILSSSDGCGKKYKCSSALWFMSCLSSKHGVAIDRAVGCTGHGKCEVDAINGVDNNTIHREAMKIVQDPDEVFKTKTKVLQTFSVNNVQGDMQHSVTLNCKHVLERKGAEGVKSEEKSAKRERDKEESIEDTGMSET